MYKIDKLIVLAFLISAIVTSCTSQKQLAYLNNLPETGGQEHFIMSIPDYKIQHRDLLYITAKAMKADGMIMDFFAQTPMAGSYASLQGEVGQFLQGYDVSREGSVLLPAIGVVNIGGLTLEDARAKIMTEVDKVFANATVECKLLSFKFTVVGEVRAPGTYINYNNYLTVFEAIGRAGGVSDFGRRDKLLVVRPVDGGTITYTLNLQEKEILSNEAYYLMPNDVIIVEPLAKKVFNLNLPTFSFVLTAITSTVTTTLLLINYFNK